MYDILELNKKLVPELRDIAKGLNIKRVESYKKQDLIYKILDTQAIQEAEKKVKKDNPKDQPDQKKEERSTFKNFLRRKQDTPKESENQKDKEARRGRRPRRDRDVPVTKTERVEAKGKKPDESEKIRLKLARTR
jgi:transcription termination factor Rho